MGLESGSRCPERRSRPVETTNRRSESGSHIFHKNVPPPGGMKNRLFSGSVKRAGNPGHLSRHGNSELFSGREAGITRTLISGKFIQQTSKLWN